MTIEMMVNASDKNVVNKNISGVSTLSGTLKNNTSIIDPVILINGDVSSLGLCNYMYIPAFGRYYYINDVISIRNDLFEVHGHVDVLQTYAANIQACEAIVYRQENRWNLYLNDGSFKVYQNPAIVTKEFPAGFQTNEFVLAVAGSTGTIGGN